MAEMAAEVSAKPAWPMGSINQKKDGSIVVQWSDVGITDDVLKEFVEGRLRSLLDQLPRGDHAAVAECCVDLSGNQLCRPDPLAELLRSLREAPVHTTVLKLHKNQLQDTAAVVLAEHLHEAAAAGRPLMQLHLSGNALSGAGVRLLVEAAHRSGGYPRPIDAPPLTTLGTTDSKRRVLWLRVEQQRPLVEDADALLRDLEANGYPTCVLTSRDEPTPEDAVVQLHFSFLHPFGFGDKGEGKGKGKSKGKGQGKGWEMAPWSGGKANAGGKPDPTWQSGNHGKAADAGKGSSKGSLAGFGKGAGAGKAGGKPAPGAWHRAGAAEWAGAQWAAAAWAGDGDAWASHSHASRPNWQESWQQASASAPSAPSVAGSAGYKGHKGDMGQKGQSWQPAGHSKGGAVGVPAEESPPLDAGKAGKAAGKGAVKGKGKTWMPTERLAPEVRAAQEDAMVWLQEQRQRQGSEGSTFEQAWKKWCKDHELTGLEKSKRLESIVAFRQHWESADHSATTGSTAPASGDTSRGKARGKGESCKNHSTHAAASASAASASAASAASSGAPRPDGAAAEASAAPVTSSAAAWLGGLES